MNEISYISYWFYTKFDITERKIHSNRSKEKSTAFSKLTAKKEKTRKPIKKLKLKEKESKEKNVLHLTRIRITCHSFF